MYQFIEPQEVKSSYATYSLVTDKDISETVEDLRKDYNPHYGTEIFHKDWFDIIDDGYSMNGGGCIYTNLNPRSNEYGYIYSFASTDECSSKLICKSFHELIKKLIDDDTLFNGECTSLCDHLNNECECGYE
jgi:hypothetical protein